jgi:mycothiol synthase
MRFDGYEMRPYTPDDAAALFVLRAAIEPLDAGDMLAWAQALEEHIESGARLWLAARGRRLAGYVSLEPLPGLPGVCDLVGGVAPAQRRRGLGGRLLAHVVAQSPEIGARRLSARVDRLDDEAAVFLLRRGFALEHEECLLELLDLSALPPAGAPGVVFVTLPRERAIAAFCRLYERCFAGHPWSQPYGEAEVAASLSRAEDLLFAARGEDLVGVAWHERQPDGRGHIEPIGVVPQAQGQGIGRALLLAALGSLRRQGVTAAEIGLWRNNDAAMNLYKGLGFSEVANWYYLARDLA